MQGHNRNDKEKEVIVDKRATVNMIKLAFVGVLKRWKRFRPTIGKKMLTRKGRINRKHLMWKPFFEWRPKAWLFFVYLCWESSFESKHSNDVIFGRYRGEASVASRIIYRCSTAHEAQGTTFFLSFTLSLSAGNGIWLVKLSLIKL